MKERELRDAAKCGICGNKIGQSGLPMFWRLRIERHGLNAGALQRQSGLEMMMGGNVALAQVFSPGEDMTESLLDPIELTVCEDCAMKPISLPDLVERASEGSE